jgi:hypothetical protein
VKKLTPADLLDLVAYEKARREFLARTIALKQARRIAVGNELTFIFENRDTVRFQVQEMLRAERVVEDEAIQYELNVYNELIPGAHELSATLMIEITESERIRPTLDRLAGIDEHVFLDVGDHTVLAQFDERQFEEERISAVQYVRFPLGAELSERFCNSAVPAALRVAHPAYQAETPLTGASRASLAADLAS